MDLLGKFNELYSKGYPMGIIVENIFLNYNAYTNNDDIYFLKKKIATHFKVELNCVKLIGSSHTGFKEFKPRQETKDYDFAIIDPFIFRKFLLKIETNKMNEYNSNMYAKNLMQGKLHILYSNREVREQLDEELEEIKQEMEKDQSIKIDKHISMCFYISEEAFINNLISYFNRVLLESMKSEKSNLKPLKKIY